MPSTHWDHTVWMETGGLAEIPHGNRALGSCRERQARLVRVKAAAGGGRLAHKHVLRARGFVGIPKAQDTTGFLECTVFPIGTLLTAAEVVWWDRSTTVPER